MQTPIILEACVETLEEAVRAEQHGADRLELCSALHLDGLTPSLPLVQEVLRHVKIPVKVMIRSRAGSFIYSEKDISAMLRQVDQFSTLPVSGFVFGALDGDALDLSVVNRVAEHAAHIPLTVHKAIDATSDPVESISGLLEISNIEAVLTSGGAPTAIEGYATINAMHDAVQGKLQIIAAGRITRFNLNEIRSILKVQEYHGRRIVSNL